jgi:hypothetical protein
VEKPDLARMVVAGLCAAPRLGPASGLRGISMRVCKESISIIGLFEDLVAEQWGCCVCQVCSNGQRVCVYGDFGCDPGCV